MSLPDVTTVLLAWYVWSTADLAHHVEGDAQEADQLAHQVYQGQVVTKHSYLM
jgi:hypothetical protein